MGAVEGNTPMKIVSIVAMVIIISGIAILFVSEFITPTIDERIRSFLGGIV